jgi:hypothetical protein
MVSHGFRFRFLSTSATFLMLPGLEDQPLAVRSTTNNPFLAAALAIFPRLDPPIKTILPLLCTVGGADMLREKEGGLSSPTQNFSFNSLKTVHITVFSSFSGGGDGPVKGAEHEVPYSRISGPGGK